MSVSSRPRHPAASPDLPVTWCPYRTRVVLLAAAVAVFGVLLIIAVMLPEDWGVGDRGGVVAIGLLSAGVLVTLARPKVIADRNGVTVVNLMYTRRLEWAEVVRVNLRRGDPWATLDLADGTTLAAMGIQPSAGGDQAIRAALQLRGLVDAHGTAAVDR